MKVKVTVTLEKWVFREQGEALRLESRKIALQAKANCGSDRPYPRVFRVRIPSWYHVEQWGLLICCSVTR